MQLNEYQKEATQFAKYGTPAYPFLALGEEAGEVLGKIAKACRKTKTNPEAVIANLHPDAPLQEELVKELGDVLWQLQACANEIGVSLEAIAQVNLDKLHGRESRGTIVGEGDER